MTNFAYVAVGGALGAMCRYGVARVALLLALSPWWSTLFVNVAGSFAFGVFARLFERESPWRLAVIVGFLGAFTTFSSFSGEAVHIWRHGRLPEIAGHFLAHNILSFGACLAGFMVIEALRR